MKKIILLSAVALWLLALGGCEKDKNENINIQNSDKIKELKVETSIKVLLDSIFSHKNKQIANVDYKEKIQVKPFVITSDEDLAEIYKTKQKIDFDKVSIIAGLVKTPSVSDKIESIDLYNNNKEYELKIVVNKAADGWAAVSSLFFWKVYPKMNTKKIIYKIKYE